MPLLPARRLWFIPDCPQYLIDSTPEGYGTGTVALCYGGSDDDYPPVSWVDALPSMIGLTSEAASTVVLRRVEAFQWVVYYDPTGQATPATPKIPEWPPQ